MARSRNKKNKKLIKKQKKNTAIISLPHEIIENILSRIPVKYLCRFKSVSKKWNSTISDPTFAEIHLQQSKNNPSHNLVAWEEEWEFEGFHVTKPQNNEFRLVLVVQHPWEENLASTLVSCYCDGLYLKESNKDKQTHFLWNPSTRTYKMLHCPYPLDDFHNRSVILYGICYDILMKDYKVVIADKRHYAVFSCRNEEWSEVKEMEDYSWDDTTYCNSCEGVSFNGSFYWTVSNEKVDKFEIIRFDCRDEKLKKLPSPKFEAKHNESLYLASFGGHLCLFFIRVVFQHRRVQEVTIMKKDDENDSWTEFKVLPQWPCYCVKYRSFMCSISENEIIVEVDEKRYYRLYNLSKNTCAEIRKTPHRKYSNPIPYFENLFLL